MNIFNVLSVLMLLELNGKPFLMNKNKTRKAKVCLIFLLMVWINLYGYGKQNRDGCLNLCKWNISQYAAFPPWPG